MKACPSSETVQQILERPEREADFQELLEHLEHCEACRSRWTELDSNVEAMKPGEDRPPIPAEVMQRLKLAPWPHGASRPPDSNGNGEANHGPSPHLLSSGGSSKLHVRCPSCNSPTEVAVDTSLTDLDCSVCGSHFSIVQQGSSSAGSGLAEIGRFELLARVGFGSFGTVWKARDRELDRLVAVKIPRQSGIIAQEQEKFFREARAAAQLRHPNIVTVHEVGRHGDLIYIVSNFIAGSTLSDWLGGQHLTGREASLLCAQIADALHHAHEQRVVHRDLKPANIIMDQDGNPHVTDFGLARRELAEVTMTLDGQVLGTPAYMSPEQAQGSAHQADRRSDVYSLGVILFQLLTGELPFRGNARMILHQLIHDEPPSPRSLDSSISRDLATIVSKCLEKSPSRRYQSALELADDLRRFLSGRPIVARPLGFFERQWRWCRNHKAAAGLITAIPTAAILVAIVATVAAIRIHEASRVATNSLYESLIREAVSLRAARTPGYREEMWKLLQSAASLDSPLVDMQQLRQEALNSMGDFVGMRPVVMNFASPVTCLAAGEAEEKVCIGTEDGTVAIATPRTNTVIPIGTTGAPIVALARNGLGDAIAAATSNGELVQFRRSDADQWKRVVVKDVGRLIAITIDAKNDCVSIRNNELSCELCSFGTKSTVRQLPVSGRMFSAAFDSKLRRVALGAADGTITVCDLENATVTATASPGIGPIHDLSFAADGQRLASAGGDGFALIDAKSGVVISQNRETGCKRIALTPSGRLTAVSDPQGRVRFWNNTSNSLSAKLVDSAISASLEYPVGKAMGFSKDGRWLFLVSGKSVSVWDRWKTPEAMSLEPHDGGVAGLAFSPDGKHLASVGKDGRCIVSNVETGRAEFELTSGSSGPLQTVAYDHRGRFVAAGGWGSGLQLWNVQEKKLIARPLEKGNIWSVAFSRDGTKLAASGEGGVWLWHVDRGSADAALRLVQHFERPITFFCTFSPQSDALFWSGDVITSFTLSNKSTRTYKDAPMAPEVMPLALLANGSQALFIAADGGLRLYDLSQNRPTEKWIASNGSVSRISGLAVSADGRWAACHDQAPGILVVDRERQLKPIRLPASPTGSSVWFWTWSPDARQIAMSCADGTISIWDLDEVTRQLRLHGL